MNFSWRRGWYVNLPNTMMFRSLLLSAELRKLGYFDLNNPALISPLTLTNFCAYKYSVKSKSNTLISYWSHILKFHFPKFNIIRNCTIKITLLDLHIIITKDTSQNCWCSKIFSKIFFFFFKGLTFNFNRNEIRNDYIFYLIFLL